MLEKPAPTANKGLFMLLLHTVYDLCVLES